MSSDRPANPVPNSYTELVQHYRPLLRWEAYHRWGVHPNDVDDVLSSMWELCLRRDILAAYDPEKGQFLTFLKTVFNNHIFSWRRAWRRRVQHGYYCTFDPQEDLSWLLGQMGTQLEAGFDQIDEDESFAQLIAQLRVRLVNETAASAVATDEVLAVWDELVRRVAADLPCVSPEIAAQCGIAERAVRARRAWIAEHLHDDMAALR